MPASYVIAHQDNLRATVEDRLWFAGEASSVKYFGFLHGAYFEGQDAGSALAECVQNGGCAGLPHAEDIF
ncbi:amine oxidase [Pyrrhoderma noxium]|uniref:Amine oxidase n=1 Tax=Pyrrhoderma noxium TaxID=2282107 RepID=A0A286UC06_9AGAM|nr:amine oxidase [Pyrrhoderma noxium]